MRLFVALDIAAEVREALIQIAATLEPESKGARWSRPDARHVTLKFLGETGAQNLETIRAALAEVRSPQSVSLRFCGVDFVPDETRPRMMWCRVTGVPNLSGLASALDLALQPLGFKPESRPVVPRVTLARFNSARNLDKLVLAAAPLKSYDFGSAQESEFYLFESMLKPSGSEYKKLATFRFVKDAQ